MSVASVSPAAALGFVVSGLSSETAGASGSTGAGVTAVIWPSSFSIRAIRLPDLKVLWAAGIGEADGDPLKRPLQVTRDHLVVSFSRVDDEEAAYGYAAVLVDKQGRSVQNIRGGVEFDHPPVSALSNGGIVFSVDMKVEAWR